MSGQSLSCLRRLAFCGAALVLLACLLACGHGDFDGLEITVLDVGQGDAALIRMHGEALLIDAGPNASEEKLCATLAAMGIEQLDTVIFTHPDEDHIGGGDLLFERFTVGRAILAPKRSDERCFTRLVEAIAASGVEPIIGVAGVELALGDAKVTLLAPSTAHTSANASSIVTRIDYGETAVLFMGDADEVAEAALLDNPEQLRADLIKIGHHGADTSTSDALLDAVRPVYAAISCGRANLHGHPNRRVIEALAARNIAIARTDRDGSITYRSDGKTLRCISS